MTGITFNPDKDIPSLSGKVILITGGTSGLGRESIYALAKHSPEHIFFTGRSTSRATEVVDKVKTLSPDAKITFIDCDLASLKAVQKAAREFATHSQRLDILYCNAGILGAADPGVTVDGYERTFATNHLGHALLTKLLLPTLLQTAKKPDSDVRIVNLSSLGYLNHPKGCIIFDELKTPQENLGVIGHWVRYGQSKVANIIYASELARQHPDITSVSIHPGVINTEFVENLSFWNKALVYVSQFGRVKTPEVGAYNQLWGATSDKAKIVNGAYYEPVGVLGMRTKESEDPEIARRLWDWTQEQLEPYKL